MGTRSGGAAKRSSERARPSEGEVETPFGLLKNARRRRVLRALGDRETASIEALARDVADAEFQTYTEPEWRQVYASLSQTHLPELDSDGLVEYDRTNGEVAIGDVIRFDRVTTAVEKVRFLASDAEATELDRLFDVLDDERRRLVLRILYRDRDRISIDELARRVASIEEGASPDRVSERQVKRRYLSLYRRHLPRLTNYGIVEREERTDNVSLRGSDERVYYLLYGEFLATSTRLRWRARKIWERATG